MAGVRNGGVPGRRPFSLPVINRYRPTKRPLLARNTGAFRNRRPQPDRRPQPSSSRRFAPLDARRLDHAVVKRASPGAAASRSAPTFRLAATFAAATAIPAATAISAAFTAFTPRGRTRTSCPRCAPSARQTTVSADRAPRVSSARSLPRPPVAARLADASAPPGDAARRVHRPCACRQLVDPLCRCAAHGRPSHASEGTRPPCAVAVQHAQPLVAHRAVACDFMHAARVSLLVCARTRECRMCRRLSPAAPAHARPPSLASCARLPAYRTRRNRPTSRATQRARGAPR